MPKLVKIKRNVEAQFWEWWTVCVCFDNETLGFMERLLQSQGYEVKITD